MNDDYLSVSQVAKLKGVSRGAVYKAIEEERLASIRLVGLIAIERKVAQAWIPRSRTGRRQGIPVTEATKSKIAASQRQRWQQRKGQSQ